jgi:hypothetical protein
MEGFKGKGEEDGRLMIDLVTQGMDGRGTFPCPKMDSGKERCKGMLSSAVGHKNQCPPSKDKELSICEDTVHCSYSIHSLLFIAVYSYL